MKTIPPMLWISFSFLSTPCFSLVSLLSTLLYYIYYSTHFLATFSCRLLKKHPFTLIVFISFSSVAPFTIALLVVSMISREFNQISSLANSHQSSYSIWIYLQLVFKLIRLLMTFFKNFPFIQLADFCQFSLDFLHFTLVLHFIFSIFSLFSNFS